MTSDPAARPAWLPGPPPGPGQRVAVVTGASGGLGRGIAEALAHAGFFLVLQYHRNEARALALRDRLGKEARVTLVHADLSTRAGAEQVVRAALDEHGELAVLVNNAAVKHDAKVVDITDEQWEDTLRVNLTSAMYTTRAALPAMYQQRYGRVIHVTSIGAQTGFIATGAYAAAKAGLIGFTRVVAVEGAKKGVTCNAVAPGLIEAGLGETLHPKFHERLIMNIPSGVPGEPGDVGRLVAFLASPGAGYISGQVLSVNGALYM